jgi:uncharacterized protein YidB (DUF937 family)
MANQEIRELASKEGIKLWQIADKLGINDGNLSRKLRHELPEAQKERVIAIIEELKKEA